MIYPIEEIKLLKKQLRIQMLQKRNELDLYFKKEYDKKICDSLIEIASTNSISTVHCYLPFAGEIDILPFIQYALDHQICVVIPKTMPKRELENRILKSLNPEDIEIGIKQTLHPKNSEIFEGHIDLIVVPGLAFDANKYRLGYGGGYYDNFLINQQNALKIGVFYPFQSVENVPTEPHDISFDRILCFS